MGVLRRVGCGLVVSAGLLLGASAPGVSAYSVSGGTYTGTATDDPTFTVGGFYEITCPMAWTTFAGTATGWPVTYFRPYYGGIGDCDFFGFPADVTQDGSWGLTVSAGPTGSGIYTGSLHLPAATTTTIEIPIVGCTVTITGTQHLAHGSGWNAVTAFNVWGGIAVAYGVDGVAYSASGCPFSSGSDGSVSATFVAPGPTIS